MPESRSAWVARTIVWPALLTAVCLLLYASGLTAHGLKSWQESQRALVGREMYERGAWVVPTVHGEPYIAKPPLMYWCQIAIGHARRALGAEPFTDETEVRLTVALAGTLGVLATWFVARRMLFERSDSVRDWGAGIAGLGLATGVLYMRSSRTGELDILLAPFVVVAIGAMHACWANAGLGVARRVVLVAVATVAMVGAALTKGPPALLVPLVALVGGTALALLVRGDAPPVSKRAVLLGAVAGASALGVPALLQVAKPVEAIGVVSFALYGAGIGSGLAALVARGSVVQWGRLVARAHPWITLGVPIAVLWGWSRLVAAEIGADTLKRLAGAELDNNLRFLDPGSPVSDWGFFAYGVLPMSIATIACLVWIGRDRPRLSSGAWTVVAWALFGLLAFSALGKGVARYLLPLWPACAMLGALLLTDLASRRGPGFRAAVVGALVLAGAGQAVWYGAVRPRVERAQSPRELVAELERLEPGIELHTFDLACPAIDYYADRRVDQWVRPGARRGRDLNEFVKHARGARGPLLLLVPIRGPDGRKNTFDAVQFLRNAGLRVETVPVQSRFRWESADSEFGPVRVFPEGGGEAPGLP